MNKIKFIIIFLVSFFIFSNFSLKNNGLFNFQYFKDDENAVSNVKTYFDGLIYLKYKNKILKIFPDSYLEFSKSNDYILKEGIVLIFDDNLRSKKICKKSDVEVKVFLENQIGKAQFYRLKLSSFLKNTKFEVKINYINKEDNKSISTKLHFLSEDENYINYGFFIPLNLFWEVEKYSVDISIYRFKKLIGKIITTNIVYPKKWPEDEQIINFNRSKSYEIARLDREKYKKELELRNKIWRENNPHKYFLKGFNYPVKDIRYITSEFGLIRTQRYHNGKIVSKHIHNGLDIANIKGTPVYAPCDGIIRYAQESEIFGNMIVIEHGFSLYTNYAHLDQIIVKVDQIVKKGDLIGYIGNTGWSTGPHLHWEARIYGIPVDPRTFFSITDIIDF
jgi:hypothetical protein